MTRTEAVCRALHRSLDVDLQLRPHFEEPGAVFGEQGTRQNAGSTAICLPIFEYTRLGHTPPEIGGTGIVESTVELLGVLLSSALILLVSACIFGSTLAALRAVRRESDDERESVKNIFTFGAEVTLLDDRMIKTGIIVMTSPENHYGL